MRSTGRWWGDALRRLAPRRPRSLRAQLAIGSALLALVAVLVVSLSALGAIAFTFGSYEHTLLANEVAQVAEALGQGARPGAAGGAAPAFVWNGAGSLRSRRVGGTDVWVMGPSGQLLLDPAGDRLERQSFAHDRAIITPALRAALRGSSSERALGEVAFPPLAQRLFAAAPVHAGGGATGPIVAAVALSTPPQVDRGAVFTTAVTTIIIVTAVLVALLAAGMALIFADRLAGPLARLSIAAHRMAEGDYGARVVVSAPAEYAALAGSFNEMATALERDVAELRGQEQLRRELVGNISHELATPLTAIQGFTEALLDQVVRDPAQQQESLRTIAREAARLQRLVDQLRDVTRLDAGAPALVPAPLQVGELVEAALAVVAPEAERQRVAIRNDVPAELPLVLADEDRLSEILLNLLDNALRYTPDGGQVVVSGAVRGRYVRLEVADSGPGIAPADRERVFDRFYRADESRTAATGGTGLGLAIVRALVEAHGGTIHVDESASGGASFSFTLPLAEEADG